MFDMIVALASAVVVMLKSRRQLCFKVFALRHQVQVLKRGVKRPALNNADRLLWIGLTRIWSEWKNALVIVRPETVVGWQRKAFRAFWRWKSRPRGGRPPIDSKVIHLIHRMWKTNPTWGSIRIQDKLALLALGSPMQPCASIVRNQRNPFLRIGDPFLTTISDAWQRWTFSLSPPPRSGFS